MSLTFTILGCGSSMGVPRVALGWGECDPNNPKNRRRRCSLMVERANAQGHRTRVLVDCSPDLRMQLLDADVDWIDGVLLTHEHADHTHGIDDLRPLFAHKRRRVDVYLDEPTSRAMHARFGYCFMTPPGSNYPPIATEKRLVAGHTIIVEGQAGTIEVLPVLQDHGDIPSLGFRFGNVAYSADIKNLPAESIRCARGARRLDCGCLAQDATSEPLQSRRSFGVDCPDQAETRNPDQPPYRHGLRIAAHEFAIRGRTRL